MSNSSSFSSSPRLPQILTACSLRSNLHHRNAGFPWRPQPAASLLATNLPSSVVHTEAVAGHLCNTLLFYSSLTTKGLAPSTPACERRALATYERLLPPARRFLEPSCATCICQKCHPLLRALLIGRQCAQLLRLIPLHHACMATGCTA